MLTWKDDYDNIKSTTLKKRSDKYQRANILIEN